MKAIFQVFLVAIGFITTSYAIAASQPMSPEHFCDGEFPRHHAVFRNNRFSVSENVRVWLSEVPAQSGDLAGEPILQSTVRVKIEGREEIGIREQRNIVYVRTVKGNIVSRFNEALDKWRREADPDSPKISCSHCVSIEVWTCNDGELSEHLAIASSPDYDAYRDLVQSYLDGLETTFPGQLEWREDFFERSDLLAEEQKKRWNSLPGR